MDVLFEEQDKKGRWRGRTTNNKLVFVESDRDLRGEILPVRISWTGPWSMQGQVAAFDRLDGIQISEKEGIHP